MNAIKQCVFFCVWLLSAQHSVCEIHPYGCLYHWSTPSYSESLSLVKIHHDLFIRSPADGHLLVFSLGFYSVT